MRDRSNPVGRNGKAGFIIHYKGLILVSFDKDRLLTEILRRAYSPTWQPGTGCWALHETLCKEVTTLLATQLDYIIHAKATDSHEAAGGPVPISDDWRVLHVQPGAPKAVVDAAYKALAMMHHPDHNGPTELMSKINCAYDRLKKVLI